MPPKRKESSRDAETQRKVASVKRRREGRRSEFFSSALHSAFESHVTAAQNAFLRGDSQAAEKEAAQALRIRPTAHLFALLAVIAESKGKFGQASDFRLLQAFLARDVVLWEELLHDFMKQQLYYKSVVCLQRMSALEKNQERYRALQLQLADLLIGLGEIRRASNVLVPLWNSSRCRDFEVFALLSSLYFQLGKWASLQRLIESSVRHAFQLPPTAAVGGATSIGGEAAGQHAEATADVSSSIPGASQQLASSKPASSTPAPRVSKRVRFFGMDADQDSAVTLATADADAPTAPAPLTPAETSFDEFGFDDVVSPSSALAPSASSHRAEGEAGGVVAQRSGVIHQLYGERIELYTPRDRKNFLTLINVHAELLNEQGSFSDTVQLLHMAAGCLDVDLMELPPDLLVRLGVAYAFLGGVHEQPCRDVFQYLVENCSMEDYGDVLLDAALSLQKVGMHEEAAQVYVTLARYHQFVHNRVSKQVGVAEAELLLMQDTAPFDQVQAATHELNALREEEANLKTVLAAALQGKAQSLYAMEQYEEARGLAEQVLQLDPMHVQARLLLGRYYFYQCKNTVAAVDVLTPSKHEPALQRIQLGVFLVHVFQSEKRFVEAIALGVSIFELLLSGEEDGDTQSVAPGTSSRRSGASLYLPTMTRASSAIIPASSLAGIVGGSASAGGSNILARTSSLAASIRASTSVARQQLARRGLESLTTTVYGASAAASLAAGWDRQEEEEHLKDTSTIFRFNRRRRRPDAGGKTAVSDLLVAEHPKGPAEDQGNESGDVASQRQQGSPRLTTAEERRAAVISMDPAHFWPADKGEGDDDDDDDNGEQPASIKVKTEADTCTAARSSEEEAVDEGEKGLSAGDGFCSPGKQGQNSGKAIDATSASAPVVGASSGVEGKGSKKRRKKGSTGPAVESSNNTVIGERDRDLKELEALLIAGEGTADTGADPVKSSGKMTGGEVSPSGVDAQPEEDAEDALLDAHELPSLEEVSRQFQDPVMAQLFLDASSFTPGGGVRGGEGQDDAINPWTDLAEASHNVHAAAGISTGTAVEDRVTLGEAVAVLGKVGLISLAVAIVDCYSAVGQFTEAREFAFVALTRFSQKRRLRQMGNGLERPLRLAVLRAALAAGESEDAYRVGLRLLQQDSAEDKRHEVVELMHSVLNRCHDRSAILYRAVAEGYNDAALLVLLSNRYYQTRSYTRVLNLYLMAQRERPSDILLNFMVGLSYLFCSHRKRTRSREACVSAAIYYLTRYQHLRLAVEPTSGVGEVLYNIARSFQFLKLYYLCIPLYERVAYELCVPEECTVALQRAARVNLYFVYRWVSGNRTLALTALQPRDGSDGHTRRSVLRPSPFS